MGVDSWPLAPHAHGLAMVPRPLEKRKKVLVFELATRKFNFNHPDAAVYRDFLFEGQQCFV
jgi:hypothetical protein